MDQVAFKVMKMGCGACVARVTSALNALANVEIVTVRPGRAVVRRESTLVSDAQIINALKAAGYDASLEERHDTADINAGNDRTV